jgi:tRNA-specific 2-thiouridylase
VNWLGDGALESAAAAQTPVFARVRSTRPPRPARLALGAEGVEVRLDEPEEGVAPGQACVLYDGPGAGARVLGGGFIRRALAPALPDAA